MAIVASYITGIFVDRIADNLLASQRRSMRKIAIEKNNKKHKGGPNVVNFEFDFHQAVMLVFHNSNALRDQIMYLRHKIRIARSIVFLFPLSGLGLIAALIIGINIQVVSRNQTIGWIVVAALVSGLGTLLVYCLWYGLELEYYRHVIDAYLICTHTAGIERDKQEKTGVGNWQMCQMVAQQIVRLCKNSPLGINPRNKLKK
jgi:hypothetical protein